MKPELFLFILIIFSIDECWTKTKKRTTEYLESTTDFNIQINYGTKKFAKPIIAGKYHKIDTTKTKVDILSSIFRKSIQRIRYKNKRLDVVFLIDASSSVGKINFASEIKFVKKMLSDFNVSFNHTRVAVVTFSSHGKIIRHIDHISTSREENDKCTLLNYEIPKIGFSGGGTYTYGALKEAKNILSKARKHSRKLICLITDGFSNGKNPVPIAQRLKSENITIITFGIQMGNYAELYNISSYPGEEHSFLLDSFAQFESMARKALHNDYKTGHSIQLNDSSLCDILCDKSAGNSTGDSCCDQNSICTCGTTSGHYACVCNIGYYGSGLVDQLCPNGTYWQSQNLCKPCPDVNHITMVSPAVNVTSCICKNGFREHEDNSCEIISCPQLEPPENGYFVKHPIGCGHVLNAACGSRCKSGYQLFGSSIRLCQENGTWSGSEATCFLKTCPSLSIPYYGMVTCKNSDLSLFFDYTPRNETFMREYDKDELRATEAMPIDTDCSFKCGPGFYMVGSGLRNCLPLSKWDGLQTTCKQILCPSLPKVSFGEYEPSDCTEQKTAHGSNCTIRCNAGFEAKGVSIKSCTGKRTGTWSNRNKQPRCVDVTPPEIVCPQNFSVATDMDSNIAQISNIPAPVNVTDNSGLNVTYWLKPSVKTASVKLPLGDHVFTYVAVDSFKNKAKCNFTISVIDVTPPIFESCIDPAEITVAICPDDDIKANCVADWEDPIVYDNSGIEVYMNQTQYPGLLSIGKHKIVYSAFDNFGNHNSCVINVSIKQLTCDVLASPLNGQTLCAKNISHTWCEVVCDVGHAIYDPTANTHLDNVQLFCENNEPKWKYENIPDCTPIEMPAAIEHVISIALDSETSVCSDSQTKEDIQSEILMNIKRELCNDLDDCEIVSHIPDCVQHEPIQTDNNRTFYNIVKRDITNPVHLRTDRQKSSKSSLRMKFLTRIGKKLRIWNRNRTRSENIKNVKLELTNLYFSEEFKEKLDYLKINIKQFKLHDVVFCRNGSVPKMHVCVQCPRGSFHNFTSNVCQLCPLNTYSSTIAQMFCTDCPLYYSTRKLGSQSASECKEQCRPGSIARLKNIRKIKPNQIPLKSLMPFCKKCNPGEFQPFYNQVACEKCPPNYASPRGAMSFHECTPKYILPCDANPAICGPHGACVPEPGNPYLYNCLCEDGFIGAHCEQTFDLCLSAPCHNQGICYHVNITAIACKCPASYTGEFCERHVDRCSDSSCRNGGICVETHGKPYCDCLPGYEGESCENQLDYCSRMPCEHGKCLNTAEGYYCQCPHGIIGRRCHLRPCDYVPCHRNAICVNLDVYPATRNSYTCRCPKGLKGFDCSQIDNPCDKNHCKNHGNCVPAAVRDPANPYLKDIDEDLYETFRCVCPPYFYGENCDVLTTPDFVLEFSKSGINDYVEIQGPTSALSEITMCAWMQSSDAFNYGTVLSYATESSDNMFTLTDYNGFVLYVNGSNIITDITLNDGQWHFLCVAWISERGFYEIYVDGVLQHTGFDLSADNLIEPNGTLIIGQEQDNLGTSFSESESFVGKIAYLDIWNRFLEAHEIQEYFSTCEPYRGSLYAWTDFKSRIKGNIQVSPSPFCKPCPKNLFASNGYVQYVGNRAIYYCHEGYKILGPKTRDCLRTSQWSLPLPYCTTVRCGHLPTLTNGDISLAKSMFGEEATFTCYDGFHLVGSQSRICMLNGTWSGTQSECISNIQCDRLIPPENAQIIYVNERGQVKKSLDKFTMGTIAEIQCLNDTIIEGESFLTCSENTQWDYPIPKCIRELTRTTISNPAEDSTTDDDHSIDMRSTETVDEFSIDHIKQLSSESESLKASTYNYENDNEFEEVLSEIQSSTESCVSMSAAFDKESKKLVFPDKYFWKNLRRFFYHGCSLNITQNKRSELCSLIPLNESKFSDLSNFESTDSGEYRSMDTKLLMHLKNAWKLSPNYEDRITFENLFEFILYRQEDLRQIPSSEEKLLRLILSFYIDAIMFDRNIANASIETEDDYGDTFENITNQIKFFIVRLAAIAFKNMPEITTTTPTTTDEITTTDDIILDTSISVSQSISDLNQLSTLNYFTTTSDLLSLENISKDAHPDSCDLLLLPKLPSNSIIKNVSNNDRAIVVDVERIRHQSMAVPVNTMVFYSCGKGYHLNGTGHSQCLPNGTWIDTNFECILITCNKPPRPRNMEYRERSESFSLGHKLQLVCNEGYMLYGNQFIDCLSTGKWSKILSRCSKISCNKPDLPAESSIISGRSYLYGDKLLIQCEDRTTIEIECHSNGKWQPNQICL